MADAPLPTFKPALIEKIFEQSWGGRKLRTASDSTRLTAEFMRVFVIEAMGRAASVAKAEGSDTIEPHHLEAVLPELLLDF
ncbi:hypothetical protein CAOG_06110 [Capsaspora owczarzaki ATCC 30864]|uniref:Centromere protein X n=1 Tax=Capsaspora owczarzaki (strain ATCC 30864) TaxID=595528 RepID=A0A0D2X498_CAPO3|nr:hypothetical protein CAOG_06110 [Capsaspora owczarzaki ATCC 30864]KJE95684.1 hypothetical protein CAOG_006110 [Capsaspora owczarzaki ATCC 30864]|eukprot:XP_004345700.1 hypothetical protein CAOG_06110 [Capsaspora owczarzaki ATCC 30864]